MTDVEKALNANTLRTVANTKDKYRLHEGMPLSDAIKRGPKTHHVRHPW